MSILPRKFYYKLHSGKNSKLTYYIGSYVAISWPRALLSLLYSRPSKRRHRIFHIDLRDDLVLKI